MTADNWLFLFIVSLLGFTLWLIFTNKVTDEERDTMLDDDEMWP